MTMRICVGAVHQPGCHHEAYMRQGVERFLAHPRTRDALTLALSQERPIHPERWAVRILVELARVAERLDGLDADCGTPNVETLAPAQLIALLDQQDKALAPLIGWEAATALTDRLRSALGLGTPNVENVTQGDLNQLDVWFSEATAREGVEIR